MFTLQDVLDHAAQPDARYTSIPTMAVAADDEGLIKIWDAGYEHQIVYRVRLTQAGRDELARMTDTAGE